MKTVCYINLTNGLEYWPDIPDARIMYMKSTHYERHELESVLLNLSDDLLFNLAIGNRCVIYDCGMYSDIPRTVWEGIPWIRYALSRAWFDREIDSPVTRGSGGPRDRNGKKRGGVGRTKDLKIFFRNRYNKVDKRVLKRLEYFRKFLLTDAIRLESVSKNTTHDGDNAFYLRIVRQTACGNKN